ncbi:tetratricopeptide repeat protein [Blastopirellula sp. JC732]|uniref:Tetratricopeptide repeat protein n=1 Tax=Blastopirellula sediminis TaxID=2894196 RepID=A0A9X1MND3_9BACT|nr:tetratricopeptide repeat protein [Blastopirellula sediminis]MCC9606364.1 tetratricopeptide repeat protein [Blastopirellula sediminis]MCC9630338.1 tetratricopeptide repeat protein [Blastopirellula sediminis]
MFTLTRWFAPLAVLLIAAPLWAQAEGQADLDKAVDLKLSAESVDDLEKVITLSESALEKGLPPEDQAFAKQLLTSVLYQRAQTIAAGIFERQPPAAQWKELRDKALADANRALKVDPTLGEMQLLKSRLLMLPDGDKEEAKKALDAAIENLKEDDQQLSRAIMMSATLETDPKLQVEKLSKAIKTDPDNVDALKLRGVLYLQQEDFEKASADLKQVMDKNPNDVAVLQAYADTLAGMKKFDEAIALLDKTVAEHPGSPVGYLLRARLKVLAEDSEGAIQDLDQVLAFIPRSIPALMMRARLYIDLDRPADAEKDLDRILGIEANLPDAIILRSVVLTQQGKFDQAIKDLESLLQRDPNNESILIQIGMIYNSDNQPRKAIQIFDTVLKKSPDSWQALSGRSNAQLSIGAQKEAIEGYEQALKLHADDDHILNNLAWVLATSPDDSLRNGERSLELAKKACDLTNYEAPHILSTLAAAYAETGNFDEAKKWAQKAVDKGTDEDIIGHLKEELASYEAKKPWREKQETTEKDPNGAMPPALEEKPVKKMKEDSIDPDADKQAGE